MSESIATAEPAEASPDGPLDSIRILLVEDDAGCREALAMALEDQGAWVKAVASVDAALECVEPTWPSVLISDIEMPERDGFALIREVRARDARCCRRTPAIAVTGLPARETVAAVCDAGFDAHLAKPVDLESLVARILQLAA